MTLVRVTNLSTCVLLFFLSTYFLLVIRNTHHGVRCKLCTIRVCHFFLPFKWLLKFLTFYQWRLSTMCVFSWEYLYSPNVKRIVSSDISLSYKNFHVLEVGSIIQTIYPIQKFYRGGISIGSLGLLDCKLIYVQLTTNSDK